MTYTETLRYLHQLELQKDSEQEAAQSPQTDLEFTNQCLSIIKSCFSHVENATFLISKGYDVNRQTRIIKAQIKPIKDNISRLEKMGRKNLVGKEAIHFLENILK